MPKEDPYEHVDMNGVAGNFSLHHKQIAHIVNLDNHHHEESGDYKDQRIIASRIIQEDCGGIEGICAGLNTDVEVSIYSLILKDWYPERRLGRQGQNQNVSIF